MKRLVSIRNILLFLSAVAVLIAIPLSGRLEFDQRIESFFAADNPDLVTLIKSRTDFGGDEFVIVAWTEPNLFAIETAVETADDPLSETASETPREIPPEVRTANPTSLDEVLALDTLLTVSDASAARIRALAERLNAVQGVNASQTQHLADFLDAAPRFRNSRRAMLRLFEGTLIGKDGRTTGILLELLTEEQAGVSRGTTLHEIRRLAAEFSAEAAVAGEPVQVFDMFEMIEQDGQILFLMSLTILSLVLLVMFRGLRWILAPVGLVLGAVVVTRAILYVAGAELSMVSSMLNSLVTVIGIATCMHVIVHYRDLRAEAVYLDISPQPSSADLAAKTLSEMAAPVFWTGVTTIVGFGSLFVSQITPVRSFALMMCLGTAVVLVGCVVLLPATLGSGTRLRIPTRVPFESWLEKTLLRTCDTVERHPLITGLACLTMFAGSLPGILRLTVETDFSKNFKEDSTIVQALKFVESRLGGAGSWEVSFDTPPQLTDAFLKKIERLTETLRQECAGDDSIRILSLTDVADLPPRVLGPAKAIGRLKAKQPNLVGNFHNEERQRMRIVLRSTEQQSSENKQAQIERIRHTVRKFFDENPDETDAAVQANAATSGMFILLAELIMSLLDDQLLSFMVACGGILICMSIEFRSLRIGLLSLLPNIFPVAVLMGVLGWIGTPVNIGTAMITSVSMGITVDSTIHYITAFERARRTMSVSEALRSAHGGAGRAMVFAYLALIVGFSVLTVSRFVPLVYFGALLSLSMVGGIFGDLVLLPLLLRLTTPKVYAQRPD